MPGSILIVEDQQDLMQVFRDYLDVGFPDMKCIEALTYAEAMSAIDESKDELDSSIAVALIDHQLDAGNTGIEIVRQLKTVSPDTAIFLLTGKASPRMAAVADSEGATVLWKPIRLRELVDVIKDAL